MKKILLFILFYCTQFVFAQKVDYIDISTKFVESVRLNDERVPYYLSVIAKADESELLDQLKDDDSKKAFFINLYNAFTNSALRKNPDQYKDRNQFFKSKQFVVAGNQLSLDIIEHGFLRKSSIKWSLGNLHKLFPSKLDKKYRVDKVDYRIHFSLNCGAKSCPPVTAYSAKNLDKQLDSSTKDYLKANSSYNKETNILKVPSLMSWFRGDFGNKKGVLEICRKFKIVPENVKPKIEYNSYDWTIDLDNFKK